MAALILYLTLSSQPPQLGTVTASVVQVVAPASVPASKTPPRPWSEAEEDVAGHAIAFALLGGSVALWYATSDRARRAPQRTLLATMLGLWLFGGLTEYAQSFIPTRGASLSDLGLDVLGAFVGFLAGGAVWRVVLARFAR